MQLGKFQRLVWAHYKKYGRHTLPWRPPTLKLRRDKTFDPYRVLVAEIMLQQTQVERVVPFYKKFIKRFPTARALARAPLSEVLKQWQGLGYNRRAKALHQAAKDIVAHHKGVVPRDVSALGALPGIGPYTARAIAAFAFNQDVIFVETNIRTAILHHFYTTDTFIYESVSDTRIQEILEKALPKGKAREWHSALMDYGAHLKRSGVRINARSAHYTKQSKFDGSAREARGAILRELAQGTASSARLTGLLGTKRRAQMRAALEALQKEKLVEKNKGKYMLAG